MINLFSIGKEARAQFPKYVTRVIENGEVSQLNLLPELASRAFVNFGLKARDFNTPVVIAEPPLGNTL